MPSASEGPLTKAHKRMIDEQLYTLNELQKKLDKAAQAGMDVSEIQADRDAMYDLALKIKAAYFPAG